MKKLRVEDSSRRSPERASEKYEIYFLSRESYSKVIIGNSVFWYSFNMIRMLLKDRGVNLHHFRNRSDQVFLSNLPPKKIVVGVDVLIREKSERRIYRVMTSVDQIFYG